jgi:hypothetical protein
MASLACADLFVGLIVMPFAIIEVVFGDYWPIGRTSCDLWHSIDVCASTASILDLCVIALDRYSAITNPISYHQTFFVKRWPYLLVAVWLCSGKKNKNNLFRNQQNFLLFIPVYNYIYIFRFYFISCYSLLASF